MESCPSHPPSPPNSIAEASEKEGGGQGAGQRLVNNLPIGRLAHAEKAHLSACRAMDLTKHLGIQRELLLQPPGGDRLTRLLRRAQA